MASAANLNDVQPEGFFTRRLSEADAAVAEWLSREEIEQLARGDCLGNLAATPHPAIRNDGHVLPDY